jgi:hypothetical protein
MVPTFYVTKFIYNEELSETIEKNSIVIQVK